MSFPKLVIVCVFYVLVERGKDEPDAMLGDGQQVSERVKQLARGLQRDIARIITFSNEDLQVRSWGGWTVEKGVGGVRGQGTG